MFVKDVGSLHAEPKKWNWPKRLIRKCWRDKKKKTLFSFNLGASFQSVCAKMQFEALIYWPDNERSSITRTKAHPSADFAENHLIHSLATSAIWWSIWFWWWIFFFKWKQLDWTSAVAVLPRRLALKLNNRSRSAFGCSALLSGSFNQRLICMLREKNKNCI